MIYKKLMATVCVDVGWNTAIAYFLGRVEPVSTKLISIKKSHRVYTYNEKLYYMSLGFNSVIKAIKPSNLYIEGVETYAHSAKSICAASQGDLATLSVLVGIYYQIGITYGVSNIQIVLPKVWKGQMGSTAVKARIKRVLNKQYPEHIQEAVGIGLHLEDLL